MPGQQGGKLYLRTPAAQCLALGAAIFAIDLAIPLGAAEGVLYTAVVLIAARLDMRRDILIASALCTLLILIGFLLSPWGGEQPWQIVFNRFLSVTAVWATAVLSLGLRSRDERVTAQTELRMGEAQFRAVFEQSPCAIVIVDAETMLPMEFNAKALELLEYDAREFRQVPVSEYEAAQGPQTIQEYSTHVSNGRLTTFETRMRTKHGACKDVLVNVRMLELSGRSALLAIWQDITEQKRLEGDAALRQRQLIRADKLASVGFLVSRVAHGINNPIHATMIHAGSLKEIWRSIEPVLDFYYREHGDFDIGGANYSETREEIAGKIEAILSSTRQIESVVGELQDHAGEQPSDMTKMLQINRVVASSCALLSDMLKSSTTRFVVDYGEGIPVVRGNFQRTEQVIVNLLQNACQALRSEREGIFVSTYLDEDSGYVCVKVSDEGVGIPCENIEKVTDPFFTTRRESGGTGLGLSISANIVMEHMGRLSFAPFRGGGTTVILALPPATRMQSQCVLPHNDNVTPTEELVNEAA